MSNDSSTPPGAHSSFSDDMAQYLQVYIDESDEELEGLTEAILQLERNPKHSDALHTAFRLLHSLKGSSGMLGFEVVGNFAHELEDRFERYRSGKAVLDRETTTVVLHCVDYFRGFVGRLRAGDLTEGDPSELLDRLRALEQSASASSSTPQRAQTPVVMPRPMPVMTVSGGLKIVVHFRPGLQLADLKARLIVSRLSSIGEIIACEPPIDDAHSFDELPLFSLTLVTERNIEEVRKVANVDGVESLEIQSGELTAEGLQAIAAAATPPASQEKSPAPESIAAPVVAATANVREPAAVVESDAGEARGPASETLRIDINRLDDLMNLTGELVVANARFAKIAGDLSTLFRRNAVSKKSKELTERLRKTFDEVRDLPQSDEQWQQAVKNLEADLDGLDRQAELWEQGHHHFADVSDAVDQLTRVSKNLQRGVLNTRMVPVGPLFNRFKRVIRDLSVERKKQVQLTIQGEKTELDKRMIDALGDPLLHLVRNSIDHGLEPPDQRRAAGKPETGSIVLEAAHRGNNVLITVRDDGAGINTQKIRARVLERGLAAEAQLRELTDQQVMEYIWHPGFSTAEAVTEISGRGVGMDIVRNAISNLSGTIDVASAPGAGTTFTIRLPLTLAIIHSLLIRYRNEDYSIPIDDVREIVSIPRDQVYAVHRHLTIDVRGELIPLVSMGNVFAWRNVGGKMETPAAANGAVNVVVLHARGKTVGLSVDSLVGRADLVIKSLSENLYPVRGLSGASILGDGAVCLMLDAAALIELASERAQSSPTRN